jgi:hypothetical protein
LYRRFRLWPNWILICGFAFSAVTAFAPLLVAALAIIGTLVAKTIVIAV